ncbi:MAG: hypothetical protein CMO30_15380 [Tistrella sp.]|uniref:hypothetical protein n=1 Tax=Tistrella sp. TaxID=2024861 RepID=UPI000C4034A4|nr:hypothetical protein [Tistrella sp.]MAD38240.1 hypothetical protein [Tistrella sp.]MBA76649.1 hypothetical protein [Tistrella sp.]
MATPVGAVGQSLDEHAIRDMVSGNTATYFSADLSAVKSYFAPGGALRGLYKGREFIGRWSVENGRLCVDLPGSVDDACRTIVRRHGHDLQLFTKAGEPAGNFVIEHGNPEGF